MASFSDPLWVVTSYFNPANYKNRLRNFQAFRRNLNAPLMVVELAKPGKHQLTKEDGDIVMSLTGEDRIWQKERLINVGIGELPRHVEFVAWVDCDVIFSEEDWSSEAQVHLEKHGGLLQLFSTSAHLPRETDVASLSPAACAATVPLLTGIAIASSLRQRTFDENEVKLRQADLSGDTDNYYKAIEQHNCCGLAWAARRDVIATCGHYDRCIVGGGDRMHAFSALGRLSDYWSLRRHNDKQKDDMLSWVESARSAGLFAHIDSLDQSVYHLWHGELFQRGYRERYEILARHGFDPAKDLEVSGNGTWKWTDPNGELARDVGAYFFSRHEDGSD